MRDPFPIRWFLLLAVSTTAIASACAPPPAGIPSPETQVAPDAAGTTVIEDFDDASAWEAAPASGVEMRLSGDEGHEGGRALRVDFDFQGGGGWAAVRRAMPVTLPENYELSFWLRGEAPSNTLEFKLIDATGENVWWVNRREFAYAGGWRRVSFRRRHVEFAWGPAGGGEIRDVAALEFAITAGTGGSGTVWFDRLALTPLDPVLPYDLTPVITGSAELPDAPASFALDGDSVTAWRSPPGEIQTLTVDFLRNREFGGLIVDWDPARRPADYDVRISANGRSWQTIRGVRAGAGARDYLFLPETEARWLRLSLLRGPAEGYALRDMRVQPIAWAESRNTLFETIASDAPRGAYPKYFLGAQSYWTVIGVSGAESEALINEEGQVEVDKRGFSIEPFLAHDGQLLTWADGRHTQSLENDYLPIPSVRRESDGLALTVTAWADGAPGASTLWLRYRVENRGSAPAAPTLQLALRPFQVNPSWQFLNNPGGVATVREIAYDGEVVAVNGDKRVVPITPPARFGAATFDEGGIVPALRAVTLPERSAVVDSFGHASAALAYPLSLEPGATRDVYLAVPFHETTAASPNAADPAAIGEASLAAAVEAWEQSLDRFAIELPVNAPDLGALLRSNLGYILINRDGAAIQPGSRSYERSWIRDGSLTSAALLRLGHAVEVRDFIRWYAPFQYEDGKVPCCVDARGADPVPENDSHGQLIYLIAEYHRYTGDRGLLEELWPHVERAVAYIDSLRHTRMTAVYMTPDSAAFYGLVPQSISHEGYSAKPMHSYWDDFFVLKGLVDATYIAEQLGRVEARAHFATMRDEFRRDLMASFEKTLALHGIDFLPGSVELGDFDATSTTVGIAPGGELENLPRAALARTFEKYWENAVTRMQGGDWEAYTPYELRTVGTFVRLGARRRAHALLAWFLEHQRPAAWNHWAEVVFRDSAVPRFIGDMPHTWVGSDFIRSVLDMFVYERASDSALVLGAGILPEWLSARDARIAVHGLRTPYGTIGYTITRRGDDISIRMAGDGRVPPGGFVFVSPLDRDIASVVIDGRVLDVGAREFRVDEPLRELVLRY